VPKQIPYIKKNSFLKIPFFILEDNNEVIKQILVPNVRKLFKEIKKVLLKHIKQTG
jgi:hypothetical protein